jgi:tRNA pseudouridine55 synthase
MYHTRLVLRRISNVIDVMQAQETEDRILLIDKPLEWTSFDVVSKMRRMLKIKKIGHAGTLDPLATGLLILCTGKFTKRINEFQNLEKEYTGTFVLGQTTETNDLESIPTEAVSLHGITTDMLETARQNFVGSIQQVPPMHSAIKVDGKRAYDLARKGIEKILEARTVEITEFKLTRIELPEVDFLVVCSKGTYIRSLVRDFGVQIGVGAYLSALRRTRIGSFAVSDAQSPSA